MLKCSMCGKLTDPRDLKGFWDEQPHCCPDCWPEYKEQYGGDDDDDDNFCGDDDYQW